MINYYRVVDGLNYEINVPMAMLKNANKFPNLEGETLASLRTDEDVCYVVKEGESLWFKKGNGKKIEKAFPKDLRTRLSLFTKLKEILGVEDTTYVYDCSIIDIWCKKKKVFIKAVFNIVLESKVVIVVSTIETKGKIKTESLQVDNYVQNNIKLNKYLFDTVDTSVFNKISDLALKKKLSDFDYNNVLRILGRYIEDNPLPVKCKLDAWTKYKLGLIKIIKLRVIPQYQMSYPKELSASFHIVDDMKIVKGVHYFKVYLADDKPVWVNSAEANIAEV